MTKRMHLYLSILIGKSVAGGLEQRPVDPMQVVILPAAAVVVFCAGVVAGFEQLMDQS